jgi:hypothetical protein
MAGTISSLIRGARVVAHWLRPTAWDAIVAIAVEAALFGIHLTIAFHVAVSITAFVAQRLARIASEQRIMALK